MFMKKMFLTALLMVCVTIINATEVKRVACIGNSITKGSWLTHPERDSYPAVLQRMLGSKWEVSNWAVSGACISPECKNVYMQSDSYTQVKKSHPAVIAIFLGHDDARKPNQAHLGQFADGLKLMVNDLKKSCPTSRIILMTPTKVSSKGWDNDDNAIRE